MSDLLVKRLSEGDVRNMTQREENYEYNEYG